MKRTRLLVLVVLVGLSALALAGVRQTTQEETLSVSPTAITVTVEPSRRFLVLLRDASEQADLLVALGESRERNLFRIRVEQSAMLSALEEADAWLEAHPAARVDPAVDAYHVGATDIRAAMSEAQAGFLRLDFDRVARANDTLQAGARSLHQAIDLLSSP